MCAKSKKSFAPDCFALFVVCQLTIRCQYMQFEVLCCFFQVSQEADLCQARKPTRQLIMPAYSAQPATIHLCAKTCFLLLLCRNGWKTSSENWMPVGSLMRWMFFHCCKQCCKQYCKMLLQAHCCKHTVANTLLQTFLQTLLQAHRWILGLLVRARVRNNIHKILPHRDLYMHWCFLSVWQIWSSVFCTFIAFWLNCQLMSSLVDWCCCKKRGDKGP